MSCFSGMFSSLPGVRCDRFDNLSRDGTVAAADILLLSHCHTDHMVEIHRLSWYKTLALIIIFRWD